MVKRLSTTDQGSTDLINLRNLHFSSQNGAPYAAGKMFYDSDNDTLSFYGANSAVILQVGQEEWVRVVNNTGATIANGSVVYVNGASGPLPTIALARADAATTTYPAGLVTVDIASGATGFVTNRGLVRNLNTSAYSAGETLYLSSTTAGALTTSAPVGSHYQLPVATAVVINSSTGSVYVQLASPTPRVRAALASAANSATPAINVDLYDKVIITGQSTAITSFSSGLTGSPANGQTLWISITGTGSVALTWGGSYEASTVALPTTTSGTSRLDVGFIYNVSTSKWRCVAVA